MLMFIAKWSPEWLAFGRAASQAGRTTCWTTQFGEVGDEFTIDRTERGAATYPIDTELITALKSWRSSLATSITVVPRRVEGDGDCSRTWQRSDVVAASVKRFWGYGFQRPI
jgi:hypothetical protein